MWWYRNFLEWEVLWCTQCTALHRAAVMSKGIRYWVTEESYQWWLYLTWPHHPQCWLMTSVTMSHAPNVPRCPMAPVRPLTTGHIVLVSPAPLHLSTLGWQQTAAARVRSGKNRFQVTRCPPAASAGPDADLTTSNYGSCEERIGRPQKHQLWTFLIPTSFMFIIPCCGHVSNMVVPHWWVLFRCWN